MQVLRTEERNTFTEQRVDVGGAVINKKSVGGNREFQELWLLIGCCDSLSLAGLLEKRRKPLLPTG